ncbi:MAG: hypothetical protein AB7O88_20200 [Reyranellaceae bacterium]
MAKRIGLIVAALLCAPAAMAQQPAPSMSTAWRSITLDQETCIAHAQNAMRGAGLTQNYETVGQSVYGEVPSYTGAIRCIASKGVAFFVVAGPDVKVASQHQRSLTERFLQGGQQGRGQPGGQPPGGQPPRGQPGGGQPGGSPEPGLSGERR